MAGKPAVYWCRHQECGPGAELILALWASINVLAACVYGPLGHKRGGENSAQTCSPLADKPPSAFVRQAATSLWRPGLWAASAAHMPPQTCSPLCEQVSPPGDTGGVLRHRQYAKAGPPHFVWWRITCGYSAGFSRRAAVWAALITGRTCGGGTLSYLLMVNKKEHGGC